MFKTKIINSNFLEDIIEDLNLEFTVPTYWVKGDSDFLATDFSAFIQLLNNIEEKSLILIDSVEDPLNFSVENPIISDKRLVILSANPFYSYEFAPQSNKLKNICPYKVIFFNILFTEAKKDYIETKDIQTDESIEFKYFLLLARRDTFYRRLTNYFIHEVDLFKKGHVSHNRIRDNAYQFEPQTKSNLEFYLYHHYFRKDILGEYDDCHKFSCQKHYLGPKLNMKDKGLACHNFNVYKQYLNYFQFEVVQETVLYTSCLFVSEKVFKPLLFKKPFILLSSVGTLEYLRKLGFKTFHPIIDENYDSESDNVLRIMKVVKEIKRLCSKSHAELEKDFLQIKDILEYNHTHFMSKNWHFNLQKNIQGYIDENIINRK